MVKMEEKTDVFSQCPICKHEKYFIYDFMVRDINGEAVEVKAGYYWTKLEVRCCVRCGGLYLRYVRR